MRLLNQNVISILLDYVYKQYFKLYALQCLGGLCLLVGAYGLEYQFNLHPCPLCVLQQWLFWGVTLFGLLGFVFRRYYLSYLWSLGTLLMSLCGILLAGRQIWLQYFAPPQVPTCAASLTHLFNTLPLSDVLNIALRSGGDCAQIEFTLLGLSLAIWAMANYCGFFIIGGLCLKANRPTHHAQY